MAVLAVAVERDDELVLVRRRQSATPALADEIAGYAGHAHKLQVMRWVKALGLPLTMNVVLHRANLGEIDALVALAEQMGADRLELANTQYVSPA